PRPGEGAGGEPALVPYVPQLGDPRPSGKAKQGRLSGIGGYVSPREKGCCPGYPPSLASTGDGRLAEVRLYSRDGCGARRAATLDPLETGGRGAGAGGRRRDTARAGRIAPGGPEHHRARPRPARLAVAG